MAVMQKVPAVGRGIPSWGLLQEVHSSLWHGMPLEQGKVQPQVSMHKQRQFLEKKAAQLATAPTTPPARPAARGAEVCSYPACMNPVCPNRHHNEQQRLDSITRILSPLQLLQRPAIPSEVQAACGKLHSRLHALTADSKAPEELRAQLLSVVDAFDHARTHPALPNNAYDGVKSQCRKLAEGIVKVRLRHI